MVDSGALPVFRGPAAGAGAGEGGGLRPAGASTGRDLSSPLFSTLEEKVSGSLENSVVCRLRVFPRGAPWCARVATAVL